MKHRKLRIAWSAAWGIVAVLLVALWVRSYWQTEYIYWSDEAVSMGVAIRSGEAAIERSENLFYPVGWSHDTYPIRANDSESGVLPKNVLGFGWTADNTSKTAYVPFWFMTLVCIALVIFSPTAFKRFSLRTLLIATTFVAVGLGLIVWLVH